jgi:hypothetical protein
MKILNGLMQSIPCRGHRFLGGIKDFWMTERLWKMNLILEDLAYKNR